ncbi:uncharacterized protein V1513DRAFT_433805 [Lipomyces chichibuensis]|uniref:uncharacterized protein n=1 Tax=Lipomyces chichibuensis TaxID=1546026 RepID=UPI0033439506
MTSLSSRSPSLPHSRLVARKGRGGDGGSSGSGAPGHGMPASGSGGPRQRSAIACRYCRRRKIRCAGFDANPADPRCSNCIKFGQPCIFTPVSAIVGIPPADYSTIERSILREGSMPMYQTPQSNTYPLTSEHWYDQQQHYPMPTIAPTQPPHLAVALPTMQQISSSRQEPTPQSLHGQSFTGQALLPPVRIPSDPQPRLYSTTDPTNYRHSTIRRPGSEAQGVRYYSPPSRAHSISPVSTFSDPGVRVSPPQSSLPSRPVLTQPVHFSPTSPRDTKPQSSVRHQYGHPSESPGLYYVDYFPRRPPVSSLSVYPDSASSRNASQLQYAALDRQLAEQPLPELRSNVASSRASISNLLDPTGDSRSSMPSSPDQEELRRSIRSDRR